MLHFLRRIRRSLINSGSMRKYTLYAIGEIALVVIGILIALSINNWNQKRLASIRESQFLDRLHRDLIQDTIYLNRRITDSKNLIKNNKLYIKKSYQVQKNAKEYEELITILGWNSEHYVSQNSVYLELINSGQLDIFSNIELKEKVVSYYKDTEIAATHIKEYNEFTANKLTVIKLPWKYWKGFSHIFDDPKMFHVNEWEYVNDPLSAKFRLVEDIALEYYTKHDKFLDYFSDLRTKAISLIEDLALEASQ
jgi:hypothetical protein